jgi:hypothetical protein
MKTVNRETENDKSTNGSGETNGNVQIEASTSTSNQETVRDKASRAVTGPRAIKVTPKIHSEYVEMVADLKKNVKVNIGDIMAVRRAENGRDAIIMVGPNCDEIELLGKINERDTVQAAIALKRNKKIVLRYLETTVTDKEIVDAINNEPGCEDAKAQMVFITKAPRDTQTACIEVGEEASKRLLQKGKYRLDGQQR